VTAAIKVDVADVADVADVFDRVGHFVDTLMDDPSEAGLAAALAKHPKAGAHLVDYLESRFVKLEPMAGIEEEAVWWTMLEILAAKWSPEDKRAFLDRVGLVVASPDGYRWLAPFFRDAFPVSELEPWLLAGLEGDLPAARENASMLAYHLFDGGENYRLSPAGEARLRAVDGPQFG